MDGIGAGCRWYSWAWARRSTSCGHAAAGPPLLRPLGSSGVSSRPSLVGSGSASFATILGSWRCLGLRWLSPPLRSAMVAVLKAGHGPDNVITGPCSDRLATLIGRSDDGGRRSEMRVRVIGTGHVRIMTCASFAAVGHDVVGTDADRTKIDALLAGRRHALPRARSR